MRRRRACLFLTACLFAALTILFCRRDTGLRTKWRKFDKRYLRRLYRPAWHVGVAPIGVLVNASGCVIPEFDPFDASVAPMLDFTEEGRICRVDGGWVEVNGNVVSLSLSTLKSDPRLSRCVVAPLRFDVTGAKATPSSDAGAIEFPPHERRAVDAQFARVECWRRNFLGIETSAFVDFVAVAFRDPKKGEEKKAATGAAAAAVERKAERGMREKAENTPPRFSVHLIGMDSVSRHNFVRHLPKTRRFLDDLGAVQLFGYNKVGDNSLPNQMPLLAGMSLREASNLSWSDRPFIWREFGAAGFWTLFGEDWDGEWKSFDLPESLVPDHYYEPFSMEMDKDGFSTEARDCYGDKLAGEKVYDWFVTALKTHSRHGTDQTSSLNRDLMFSLIWTSDWSHELLNDLKRADLPTLKLLEEMKKLRIFEEDVVILLSDHGLRFGRILETRIGRQELSMPVLVISLPPWFHRRFQPFVRNLKINARRLTTPYDLHETLHHLLRLQVGEAAADAAVRFSRGESASGRRSRVYSLFDEVPESRTCASSGIPQQYCSCGMTPDAPLDDPDVLTSAEAIVRSLNDATKVYDHLCARLELNRIRHSYRKETGNSVTFLTTISTSPGDGIFEVSASRVEGRWKVDLAEVNRLDRYGTQSACLPWSEKLQRKICYCEARGANKDSPGWMQTLQSLLLLYQ